MPTRPSTWTIKLRLAFATAAGAAVLLIGQDINAKTPQDSWLQQSVAHSEEATHSIASDVSATAWQILTPPMPAIMPE
ncbi:MAG: hypothetical protein HY052_05640 [Proteobacteria bacterium]|nr:hypothetical protein [Pseudomonadota bacterium]